MPYSLCAERVRCGWPGGRVVARIGAIIRACQTSGIGLAGDRVERLNPAPLPIARALSLLDTQLAQVNRITPQGVQDRRIDRETRLIDHPQSVLPGRVVTEPA